MQNIRELYILQKPIDTPLGKCNFIKVKDYDEFLILTPYLNKQKEEIITETCEKLLKEKKIEISQVKNTTDELEKLSLLELIHIRNLTDVYSELFKMCFENDAFSLINDDEQFEQYRQLIRDMNCVNYEKTNPNPEIEKFNMYKRLYNQKRGSGVSIEGLITSVESFTGKDTNDMSIYKLHALFNRISQFKNFDSSVIFRTVGDVEVKGWYEDIEKEKKQELDEQSKKIIEDYRNTGEIIQEYKSISSELNNIN